MAKGKLATIHYDSAPRTQRSYFNHPRKHIFLDSSQLILSQTLIEGTTTEAETTSASTSQMSVSDEKDQEDASKKQPYKLQGSAPDIATKLEDVVDELPDHVLSR